MIVRSRWLAARARSSTIAPQMLVVPLSLQRATVAVALADVAKCFGAMIYQSSDRSNDLAGTAVVLTCVVMDEAAKEARS